MKFKICFLFFIVSSIIYSQTYDGWNEHVHTRNNYTPVESALFNMPSYVNPSFYAHTYNPALSGLVMGSGLQTSFFSYEPSDIAESKVKTISGNLRINEANSVALSYYNYIVDFIPDNSSEKNYFTTFTLGYSGRLTDNIFIGIGANYMESNNFGWSFLKIYTLDIGALYNREFQTWSYVKSNFVAQVSVDNIAGSVKEDKPEEDIKISEYTDLYPVFLNIGIANQFVFDSTINELNVLALNLQLNYSNSLNDPYFDYLRIGAEFRFFEMIYFRFGHVELLTQKLQGYMGGSEFPGNSYGLGLDFPISRFFPIGYDLRFQFNYGQSYSLRSTGGIDNLDSYSIGIMIN